MRYTLTIRLDQLEDVRKAVLDKPGIEGACYLLCQRSEMNDEIRLLCQQVVDIEVENYLARGSDHLSIASSSYVRVAKQANQKGLSIVFLHSHPLGLLDFSAKDDVEDAKLHSFWAERASGRLHGSLVMADEGMVGRIWADGFIPMSVIRVVGSRFSFHFPASEDNGIPAFYDRQVLAFGEGIQRLLGKIHVGIVGAGGTGSAVFEQLTRLGVGAISVFDEDTLEERNINRVYCSGIGDTGKRKVDILEAGATRIGVGTVVKKHPSFITQKKSAMALRNCDILFGCTDKEAPRAILTQLSLRYLIPTFDVGVVINSNNGTIEDVVGRVTTILPGEACLYCRERISPNRVRDEMLPESERSQRIAEGYSAELPTDSPAVIPFTTAVASIAVEELIHRLTGFKGADRNASEVLVMFDKDRISTNRRPARDNCFCSRSNLWGIGDTNRFLDMWGG